MKPIECKCGHFEYYHFPNNDCSECECNNFIPTTKSNDTELVNSVWELSVSDKLFLWSMKISIE